MIRNNASAVGKTVTLSSGAALKIINHNGKSGNHSRHLFYCQKCAKDTELFGDGTFWSRLHNLTVRDSAPCGCGKSPLWSYEQNAIRCQRAAKRKGLEFISLDAEPKGCYGRVHLACRKHPFREIRATVNSLVNGDCGCRSCYEETLVARAASDEDAAKKYLDKCGYPQGTTISRIKGRPGGRIRFRLWCSSCANDEYAQAGLCSGVFAVPIEALCSGEKSCRCGKTKRKPEKIARFQCESLLEDSEIMFVDWLDGYKNGKSKIIAECPDHGRFYPSPQSILVGSRCPGCSAGGYSVNRPGFLYLLESECKSMMKVGISNNFAQREKDLRNSTPFGFSVLSVISMQGPAAPVLERKILQRSKRLGLTGFNGSSEWVERDEAIPDYFQ